MASVGGASEAATGVGSASQQTLSSCTCAVVGACSPVLWGHTLDIFVGLGTAVLLALSLCWFMFALRCRSCRLRGGVSEQQPTLARLPALSVITPIKGVHVDSLDNWRSVLDTEYNGDIEFIFVVESSDDPAYAPLKQLQSEATASCSKNLQGVKVAVAGMGFHCSQKIHNMLEGVSLVNRKSKYILFLDDDVALYRNTFRDLAMEMETDDNVFVATGFPYDWLHTKYVPFPSYLKLVYRWTSLLLLWRSRVPVVWGGCMLIRREDVHTNRYGMMTAWRDRGYSDDMIVGSVCVKEKRTVALAPTCIFPHKLGAHDTMANYWNFACRQMFVLDTYHNRTERLQNYILLFFVSTFLPLVCVTQFVTTLTRTCAYLCLFFTADMAKLSAESAVATAVERDGMVGSGQASFLGNAAAAFVGTVGGGVVDAMREGMGSVEGVVARGGDLAFATSETISAVVTSSSIEAGCDAACGCVMGSNLWLLVSAWVAFVVVGLAVRWTAVEALALCNYLLPSRNQVPVVMPSIKRCVLAFLVHHLLLPCAAVFGFCSNTVTWSNVTYKVQHGRICEVTRRTPEGQLITMPWQQSLSDAADRHASRGFLDHAADAEGNL